MKHKETKKAFASSPRIGRKGQASIEYLIVGAVLLVVILALGSLASRMQEGLFVQHAVRSASHAVGENALGVMGDVLLY
jgi:amino acid permease